MRHRSRRDEGLLLEVRASKPRSICSAQTARLRHGRILGFEPLEDRHLLSATLTLSGTQSVVGNTNIDASNDHATQQQNMRIDINPTNPLHLAAISERNAPTTGTSLGLCRSSDGGRTWTTTTIDNTIDGLSATATRFDPSLAYDSNGNLYVGYGVNDGTTTTLIVATSTNDGVSFTHVVTVDSAAVFGAVSRFSLATGPDGSGIAGHEAVYVAYNKTGLLTDQIEVAGSHDGGATFTSPVAVNDDSSHNVFIGDPSVGPAGQLYVSWFDITDGAIRIDRDLDGLFNGGSMFGSDITVVNNSTARPAPLSGNIALFFDQIVPAQPNHGINSLPEMAVDRSGLSTNGNVYISFVDLYSGPDNDTDVYVARSTNQGTSWAILPMAHSGATEFMPSISVDQSSGSVNVMYNSTLGEASKIDSNVEIATSIDAGTTFVIDQALSSATSQGASVVGGNDLGDYNGLAVFDGTIQAIWADNRGPTIELEAFTASGSFSSATNANVLTSNGDASGSATDDQFVISLSAANPAFLQVTLNGQLIYAGLIATLDGSNVNGLAGSDKLTIDNSYGVVNLPIVYDGGTSPSDDDKLALTGNPGTPIARETYLVGTTLGTGTWVLDPDGSMGAGASGTKSGDECIVTFSNLEPVDSDVPATIFDVIMNAANNDATISDGGLLNGANSLLVTDNNSTFESFRFANKTTVRIMGGSGADRIEAGTFTTASAGLAELDLYGHVAPDVLGQPADDNATDTLNILRDPAGLTVQLFGQGGDDSFTVGNGDLTQLLSSVNVIGGDGSRDALGVSDFNRSSAVDYYVDPTTFAICMDPNPMDVLVHFDGTLEFAYLIGTQGANQFDVTPSSSTVININGENPTTAPGDFLSVRFAGVTNPQLINSAGNGLWTFGNRQPVVFENIERFNYFPILVYAADAARNGKPTVKVFDADTKTLVTSFTAYEANYTGGVRVAVGDINGDGIPEIVTAPGAAIRRSSKCGTFWGPAPALHQPCWNHFLVM